MTPEAALERPGVHLVRRRPGHPVVHAYTGPATAHHYVPRGRRPLCGVRATRLRVLPPHRWSSLRAGAPRLCRSCTRVLQAVRTSRGPSTQVTTSPSTPWPVSRDDYAAAYAALTPRDLWAQLVTAQNSAEAASVLAVALVLVGRAGLEEHHRWTRREAGTLAGAAAATTEALFARADADAWAAANKAFRAEGAVKRGQRRGDVRAAYAASRRRISGVGDR